MHLPVGQECSTVLFPAAKSSDLHFNYYQPLSVHDGAFSVRHGDIYGLRSLYPRARSTAAALRASGLSGTGLSYFKTWLRCTADTAFVITCPHTDYIIGYPHAPHGPALGAPIRALFAAHSPATATWDTARAHGHHVMWRISRRLGE